ncbi:hypothetical protein ACFZAV_42730 [Streptomyces sp. NPDC008343]|uniref:hypothetical protein n=1 Tax=Streptomyces sp. NPDC008343 TaxID=3364828 RepID=UPI0036E60F56
MARYASGQSVTITNPIQPTRHKGGETAVVISHNAALIGGEPIELVQIQEDADGSLSCVYPQELT